MKCMAFNITFDEIKARKHAAEDQRRYWVKSCEETYSEMKQLFLVNGLAWDNRR